MEKLYIVIPSYNEEETIEKVITDWYPVVENTSKESRLVIFDGKSKDKTTAIIKKMAKTRPQLVLELRDKIGHGPTLHMAYKYCLDHKADYIFQTDADDQTRASEFAEFWNNRKEYDAIIGHRNHRKDGFFRFVVTKTLKLVLRLIFKISVTDANTPYRLMNTKLVKKYIDNIPPKFNLPNVMLTVMFLKGKEKVKFIPITFEDRQGGKNKLNLKGIFKIGLQAIKDFKEMRRLLKYDQKKNKLLVTKQFIIYCMIGGFTSLTDTLVFYLLRKASVNLYVANFIGINVGIGLSFLLNSFINFKMTDKLKQRALKFFMVGYIGLCISFVIMHIGVKVLNQNELIVKLVSIVLVAIIQFCLNKIFTFKSKDSKTNENL